ncbi:catalase-related domain-containing protein [Gloeobacter violaceus]|uniref:catalase-related domain-containing protein n=1 Tax=Gloeobacter violaceus TaxID=33072 RepID=UPI0002D7DEB4
MSEDQKSQLVLNIVGHMAAARRETQLRQICHLFRADADYGRRVAQGLGIDLEQEMAKLARRPEAMEKV